MSNNSLKNVFDILIPALEADTDINQFCQTKFKRLPMIFRGVDPRNPPKLEENCPCIALSPNSRARENNQAHRIHGFDVGVCIKSTSQTRTDRSISFKGIDEIDEFANLIEAKITKTLNSNGFPSTQEPSFPDESIPPIFKAYWAYNVRCTSILSR